MCRSSKTAALPVIKWDKPYHFSPVFTIHSVGADYRSEEPLGCKSQTKGICAMFLFLFFILGIIKNNTQCETVTQLYISAGFHCLKCVLDLVQSRCWEKTISHLFEPAGVTTAFSFQVLSLFSLCLVSPDMWSLSLNLCLRALGSVQRLLGEYSDPASEARIARAEGMSLLICCEYISSCEMYYICTSGLKCKSDKSQQMPATSSSKKMEQ